LTRGILLCVLFSALILTAAQARLAITLKSIAVALPQSSRTLPAGPGVKVVHDNCLGCHSAGMILNQPRMPKAAWAAEVDKMRNAYKAPIAAKDVPAIVDYLAAIKGSK
jgi:cytochrome c5